MLASHRAAGTRLSASFGGKVKGLNAVPPVLAGAATGSTQLNDNLWTSWPWATWVKPQVDLAVGLGANTLKLTGYLTAWASGSAAVRTQIEAQHRQFLGYCAGQGIAVYEGGVDPRYWTLNPSGMLAAQVKRAQIAHEFKNVIGIDLFNEINTGSASLAFTGTTVQANNIAAARTAMAAAVSAARAVTSIPLTASFTINSRAMLSDAWVQAIAPWCDFLDYHPYLMYGSDPGELEPADFVALRGQSWWRPFLIGESGIPLSIQSTRPTWAANGRVSAMADCMGAIGFSVADFDTSADSNRFGVYSDALVGPRTAVSVPFAAWPGRN